MLEVARAQIENRKSKIENEDAVLVVSHESFHAGIVGIVASRIVDLYHRPTFVLAQSETGRANSTAPPAPSPASNSTSPSNTPATSSPPAEVTPWPAASNFPRQPRRDAFRDRLNAFASEKLTDDLLTPSMTLDGTLSLDDCKTEVIAHLEKLEPFGRGNPTPRFLVQNVRLSAPPRRVAATAPTSSSPSPAATASPAASPSKWATSNPNSPSAPNSTSSSNPKSTASTETPASTSSSLTSPAATTNPSTQHRHPTSPINRQRDRPTRRVQSPGGGNNGRPRTLPENTIHRAPVSFNCSNSPSPPKPPIRPKQNNRIAPQAAAIRQQRQPRLIPQIHQQHPPPRILHHHNQIRPCDFRHRPPSSASARGLPYCPVLARVPPALFLLRRHRTPRPSISAWQRQQPSPPPSGGAPSATT